MAQNAPASSSTPPLEEVVVTGIRASLESATEAKKESTGFTDSIFAEDIGKFPDTNIAESFNRIPGITISREISGEGLNIAIRGLGANFTRVLLNNAPVAVASTGRTDSPNTNREVDLDLFPTELFTQLTVRKSASAAMLEGGAAGTVDMRSARPFDNGGGHARYLRVAGDQEHQRGSVGRARLGSREHHVGRPVRRTASDSPAFTTKCASTGFETIGWTNRQPADADDRSGGDESRQSRLRRSA